MEGATLIYYVLASCWKGTLPAQDSSGQLRIPARLLGDDQYGDARLTLLEHVWHPLHRPVKVADDVLYACELESVSWHERNNSVIWQTVSV